MNDMRKLMEATEQLDESSDRYYLSAMQRYNMKITSYGMGLGIEFTDSAGKEHYEEHPGTMDVRAMVAFALDEILYHAKQKY